TVPARMRQSGGLRRRRTMPVATATEKPRYRVKAPSIRNQADPAALPRKPRAFRRHQSSAPLRQPVAN
ncbi:hypothetical protein, partial [Bradyrhizobium lablabi]|uniref:hypothetical protein n=1 Tax=Bradyrhizobium lablabi TaxID=722472 RepID=UPI001AECD204